MARQDGDRAGELLFVDHALHKGVQPLQPFGRKAHRLRRDGLHVDNRRAGGDCGSGGLLGV